VRCITNYTKLTVSLITLILVIYIFSGVNLAYESLQDDINKTQENSYQKTEMVIEKVKEIDKDKEIENLLETEENLQEKIWQVEIPAIDLIAPIAEGTTQEVMREYVGHFENTKKWQGNIGLAAHNRRVSNKLF